jgi:hypothetical protein
MPRPDVTPQFLAAIQSPYVKPAIFVQITFSNGPLNLWSGVGTISANGAIWTGVGQLGNISNIEEGTNVQARGISLTLSGIDPTLLSELINDYELGAQVLVYLGLFDQNNALIPNPILSWAGRTDQPTLIVNGDTATLTVQCENRLVDMNVSVERRYTSDDQQIDYPGDLGFAFVTAIQSQTIYWGRHPSNNNNLGVQGY